MEQWGPVSQSPVGQEVTSLRTRLSTPPMLGLAVLVLTIVPAYLLSRPNATDTARTVVSIARSNDSAEAATDEFTAVEIEAHIRAVAIRYRISPLLVAAIVEAESEFNPRAVSRKGARGLMQLMPLTASSLRVEDTFDPYKNIGLQRGRAGGRGVSRSPALPRNPPLRRPHPAAHRPQGSEPRRDAGHRKSPRGGDRGEP